MRILKSHPILSIVNGILIDLPAPSNINYLWGFGSLLGLCLIIQILSGIFVSMHYTGNVDLAFISVEHIMRDVNYGWLIRYIHANGASMFFICVFMHIGRGIYHGSYTAPREMVWGVGVVLLIVMMATAFIGLRFGRKWYNFMSNLIDENRKGFTEGEKSNDDMFYPDLSYEGGTNPDFVKRAIVEKIFKSAQKVYKDLHLVETQLKIRNENTRKAGIYILFNILNNKFYVGSAITNRIFTHFRNHCFHGTGSPVTKRAVNHHGSENFYFIIYEYFPGIVLKDNLRTENLKLLARESAVINELQPDYNIFKVAGNSEGYMHTEETKGKIRQNYREELRADLNKTLSPENFKKLSDAKIKYLLDNPEKRDLFSVLASRPIALHNLKTGELINTFPGIRVLCKYLGCCNKTLNKALKNNTPIKNLYIVKYI